MTDDKRKILRALAETGEELRQHRHRYGRESDERLRVRLTAAGLTPEMIAFLIDLADKAEAERQKQRAKRQERERRNSKFWQARAAYQDPRLVQEELRRAQAEHEKNREMGYALIEIGYKALLAERRRDSNPVPLKLLHTARDRLRRAFDL